MPSDVPLRDEKHVTDDADQQVSTSSSVPDSPTTTTHEAGVDPVAEKPSVIIVDWDGPDDPSDPRKCVLWFGILRRTFSDFHILVGHTRENGLQLPSFPPSHLCLPYRRQ